jgi:hypothetical protein
MSRAKNVNAVKIRVFVKSSQLITNTTYFNYINILISNFNASIKFLIINYVETQM